MTVSDSRSFDQTLSLEAPPEAVWAALTQDRELQRWFAPQASVTPGPGGEVVWAWGDTYRWPQRIEAWEPGRRLRTAYDSAVPDASGTPRPLWMEWTLQGVGGRTTLRLVHSGFGPEASFDDEFDGIRRGWPVELRSLRLYLERHRGEDRHLAWSIAPLGDAGRCAAAWQAVVGPQGLACGEAIDTLEEGAPFRFTTAAGTTFAGTALRCAPREFSGVAESHGGGFLRFTVEACGGQPQAWLWLASYGAAGQVPAAAAQAEFDGMLRALFGSASPAGPAVERGAS